jgi:thymidylate synthase (FAD)
MTDPIMIDTLDGQGFVRLVDYMGDDLTVVNAARVSFRKMKSEIDEKDIKLIHYLAKHKHWTPFAHPQITYHIKAPIFVARQLFKHKIGTVENEVSRRYVDESPEFYTPTLWRSRPDKSIKQGSSDESIPNWKSVEDYYKKAQDLAANCYEYSIMNGVAPELARAILPQSMMTEWYWTVSLSTAARIYHQRSDPHSQAESQEYAWALDSITAPLYPHAWDALTRFDT